MTVFLQSSPKPYLTNPMKKSYNNSLFRKKNDSDWKDTAIFWDMTMADKMMYILCNDDNQNYSLCPLQIVVKTFGLST